MNYLTTRPAPYHSEAAERIVEGVYEDDYLKRDLRAEYAVFDKFAQTTEARDRAMIEEARYAVRSGPVVVIRPARKGSAA